MPPRRDVLYFGAGAVELGGTPRATIPSVVRAAASGALRALVVDARSDDDLFGAAELLRALYDDPRRPQRVLHPRCVLAIVATGDVEAAFALGRWGIAGVIEERALDSLAEQLARLRPPPSPLTTPALAPPRSTRLGPRLGADSPPTVALAYRHAPQTCDALARYIRVLRAHAAESTVFADVAALIELMLEEGLTCQTNLASKAGAAHEGQFIGSFEFYRELRRTRYARISDHPAGTIAMDVFIAVDEVLHEVLHLLYLANELRGGIAPRSTLLAEELSLTWWQAVVHQRVFPEWLADRHILEINDDFLLCEENAERRGFWTIGSVFDRYAGYPWVPYVLASLPERASYIGERADLADVIASYEERPEAAFLLAAGRARLELPAPFASYPRVPETLRLARTEDQNITSTPPPPAPRRSGLANTASASTP
ncbi:MAG: hypothetical protein KF729_03470 [Sandaracinaceae bacterium]|nr:hypothetical protein [Sandaracinaceae bacterium]